MLDDKNNKMQDAPALQKNASDVNQSCQPNINNQEQDSPISSPQNEYTGESILHLKGLDPVRKTPGMYIKDTGFEGLHQMVNEIVENSIDEVTAGYATYIKVTLHQDGSVEVEDDGRGIPVDNAQGTDIPAVQAIFTDLNCGGKFNNKSYATSGGLHGVGSSVVNALSEYLEVWVKRNGHIYYIKFINGDKEITPLKIVGNAQGTGTRIIFKPDHNYMENVPFSHDRISARLKQLAFLNKGLKITFIDENPKPKQTFKDASSEEFQNATESTIVEENDNHQENNDTNNQPNSNSISAWPVEEWQFNGGIQEYVGDLIRNENPIGQVIYINEKVEDNYDRKSHDKENNVIVELAFAYCEEEKHASIFTFCNNIFTSDGGTHLDGFKDALKGTLRHYNEEHHVYKNEKEGLKLNNDDVVSGLSAILSLKASDPMFDSQAKRKVSNPGFRRIVNEIVSEKFEKYLVENPELAKKIVEKVYSNAMARKKAEDAFNAAKRKSVLGNNSLPGKLADCSTSDTSISELYLVEGDSAGGSAKLGRDREYQAILPLRGKIMNVEKTNDESAYNSEVIQNMIIAIGTGVKEQFDLTKLRYDKIIIMTDADVDGAHIQILLLTFFYNYMRPLIEYGHVYVAQPPLYKASWGKNNKYFYKDEELDAWKNDIGKNVHYSIQRYKGLGEMNPEQLWETTMDPEQRMMKKISIVDAEKADRDFNLLMGEDVQPRRDYIIENATFVKNIDA